MLDHEGGGGSSSLILAIMESLHCLPASDATFGPRVDPSCRGFDFTLLFEDIFFACVPTAIFLLSLPCCFVLARSPGLSFRAPRLLVVKLVRRRDSNCLRPNETDDCTDDSGRLVCDAAGVSGIEVASTRH